MEGLIRIDTGLIIIVVVFWLSWFVAVFCGVFFVILEIVCIILRFFCPLLILEVEGGRGGRLLPARGGRRLVMVLFALCALFLCCHLIDDNETMSLMCGAAV